MTPQAVGDRVFGMQSERDFSDAVIEYATLCGWKVKRDPMWRPTAASVGFPDLVLARAGNVIFAELKAKTGKVTQAQKEWGGAIGAQWRVWYPYDWPEIEKVLR
jgi:hypothetical protein